MEYCHARGFEKMHCLLSLEIPVVLFFVVLPMDEFFTRTNEFVSGATLLAASLP